MNTDYPKRDVERKRSARQMSVAELPESQQEHAMDETERASNEHPSVRVADQSLHVCEMDSEWQVWLNCDDCDFTGLCVSVGLTRDIAVAKAVYCLEEAVAFLQRQVRA